LHAPENKKGVVMKDRIHIAALPKEQGAKIKIAGHAQVIRAQSSVIFVILRDITGTVQCVIDKANPLFELAEKITAESVLEIDGAIATTKVTNSTPDGIEIQVETFKILSLADTLPIPVIEKGEAEVTSEKRQDWRFLTVRRERDATAMKVLSAFDRGYSEYLLSQGFIGIHTPKIMATPSESRAELFQLKDYFGQTAYLAQSPQLYKQMAIAAGLERVFEIGPVFRADPSFTTRHTTEFTGQDVEMGYIDSFADVMDMLENTIASALDTIHQSCGADIEKHFGKTDIRLKKPMIRITMHQVREILKSRGVHTDDGKDLTTAEEKAIGEWAAQEHDNDFVFVTEFAWAARPFYHKKGESSDTGAPISVSADLLYKGVELVTTAQREENYDKLIAQCADKGLQQEGLQWYLDCFRFGMPPHGGWGLGGARFVKQLLDLETIREAMFLFRGPNRLTP
jgi:aspartyl-tRNA synthetase